MLKKVIVLGGRGNGGVAVSCLEDMHKRGITTGYEITGWLNDYIAVGELINGYPVLGGLNETRRYVKEGYHFIWAIHPIGKSPMRVRLFMSLDIPDFRLVTLVHPLAFVGTGATLEPGVLVMANSYVGPMATVGKCSFIMANCTIGHDTQIGPFSHLSLGATVGSFIKTGMGCDIALNATVMEKVTLGDYSVVGAASLVLKDVDPYTIVVGSPARRHKDMEK